MLRIINGNVISGSEIKKANLYIEDGKITEISEELHPADQTVDAEGLYVSAGFIDTHVHGGAGADIMDATADAVRTVARVHLKHGTTSICPTTTASSHELLKKVISAYKEVMCESGRDGMPNLLGLHLEGPYFSKAQAGAQNPEYITPPKKENYEEIFSIARGIIRKWTFAPELCGAEDFCRALAREGILPSVGHSDATYDDVKAVFLLGARSLTHFYSGMSGITRKGGYRIPGVIESGYLLDGMHIEIIADGSHLPPDLLKMILKLKDNSKIMLVTDAMRGATMPEGESSIGGVPCIIENGVAKLLDRTAFAGSVATSNMLVRTLYKKVGIPLPRAVAMITENPAEYLGLSKKGKLLPSYDADVVIFDRDINVKSVFVMGKKAFGADF